MPMIRHLRGGVQCSKWYLLANLGGTDGTSKPRAKEFYFKIRLPQRPRANVRCKLKVWVCWFWFSCAPVRFKVKKILPSISTFRKRRSKVCQLWGHGGTTGRIVVPETPGTTLEISILHWQPSGQPLLETWPGGQDNGKELEDLQIHGIRKNKCTCRWKCLGAQQQRKQICGRHIWIPESLFGFSMPKQVLFPSGPNQVPLASTIVASTQFYVHGRHRENTQCGIDTASNAGRLVQQELTMRLVWWKKDKHWHLLDVERFWWVTTCRKRRVEVGTYGRSCATNLEFGQSRTGVRRNWNGQNIATLSPQQRASNRLSFVHVWV